MEEEKTSDVSVAELVTEDEPEEKEESEISQLRRVRERNGHLHQEILALSSRIRSFDLSLLPVYQDQTGVDLSRVRQSLLDASEAGSTFTSECDDLSDSKTEDLDLELLRRSQEPMAFKETFAHEEAQEEIAELQQELKESQHRVQLCEAQISERKRLEDEVEMRREKEAEAQRQLREEQEKRKVLDHQVEELEQQVRLQKEKEAQLERECMELQVQVQQQEARLRVLEEEKKTLSNELLCCQVDRTKLLEQIVALQQEKEGLLKELLRLLRRTNAAVRKHQERRVRHKAKFRRAKEVFLSELKRREACIRSLEDKLRLSKGQAEKMSSANGELLQERRKLLVQLHDLREEAERSHKQRLSAVQSRVELMGKEHKQQQEQSLHLATQVGDLQRALRKISGQNLEELQSQILPFSDIRTFRSLAAL